MNILEALAYARTNKERLERAGQSVVGVAYTPNDIAAEFQFVTLSYQQDPDKLDGDELVHGSDWYCAAIERGNMSRPAAKDGIYGNENAKALADVVPEFASKIKYRVYTIQGEIAETLTKSALKSLFPTLPTTDFKTEDDVIRFKVEAINILSEINTEKKK